MKLVSFSLFLSAITFFAIAAEIILKTKKSDNFKNNNNYNNNALHSTGKLHFIEKFLLCFHLKENFARAIKLEKSENCLSSISGIRTHICLWVTIFHVYYYSLFAINNTTLLFAKLEHLMLQPFLQSCFYVDVFFVIR